MFILLSRNNFAALAVKINGAEREKKLKTLVIFWPVQI